jgi:hypothetical protein
MKSKQKWIAGILTAAILSVLLPGGFALAAARHTDSKPKLSPVRQWGFRTDKIHLYALRADGSGTCSDTVVGETRHCGIFEVTIWYHRDGM